MTWMDLCQSLATDLNGLAASDLLHFEIGATVYCQKFRRFIII